MTQASGFISFPIYYFNTETIHLERKLFSLQNMENTNHNDLQHHFNIELA